ncbi:MAG TPA: hypothetical protein VFN30_00975 [Chitinophagaceae bacterium]|nr:hypothetical protein [Chitinophagaceae bacterium]
MVRFLLISITCICATVVNAQIILLPEGVTNNGAATAIIKGKTLVYSFYGLDSSKTWNGVHKKVFKTDIQKKKTIYLTDVPDSVGRIASSASSIHNKIYITGGYTVYPNGKEKSGGSLFIFDPQTEKFSIGAGLLLPIDDHIQCVWRDSLLYIITGWNDSANTSAVQIYNPLTNEWHRGTPVPDEKEAKVFGGTGIIVNDTLYYLGGAVYEKFYAPANILYKGVIDKNNPTHINWQKAGTFPLPYRYRAATFYTHNYIYFFGGSNETYNYNGISYNQKKPVNPNNTVLIYSIPEQKFFLKKIPEHLQRMDLRNIVPIGKNKWAIAGGMKKGQKVSNELNIIRPSFFY